MDTQMDGWLGGMDTDFGTWICLYAVKVRHGGLMIIVLVYDDSDDDNDGDYEHNDTDNDDDEI